MATQNNQYGINAIADLHHHRAIFVRRVRQIDPGCTGKHGGKQKTFAPGTPGQSICSQVDLCLVTVNLVGRRRISPI